MDAGERYLHDVFGSLASLSPYKQSDFRALVAFARLVVAISEFERQMLAVAHGACSSAEADYAQWSQMLLRWAGDFLKKV